MTRLILDIPNEPDLDVLLPLLRRFGVIVSQQKPVASEELERLHAIIDAGAVLPGGEEFIREFEESRQDRPLPLRD
jgi:hypothetical protein